MTSALIVVDLQPDFMPGGALAVNDGDAIMPVVASLLANGGFDIIVATQDWHPADHQSFASQHAGRQVGEVIDLHGLPQVLWPDHCVQDTPGAALLPSIRSAVAKDAIFRKGQDPRVDSYSGFFDNGRRNSTGLSAWLRTRDVERVGVCGLATDYCVKFTALDAREQGFDTTLFADACRGVELNSGDVANAIESMSQAGIVVTTSAQWLTRNRNSQT